MLRAAALVGYQRLVRDVGGDPAEFLGRFGIPVSVERQPDAFVSFNGYTNLLEVTADELHCPDFGLRLVSLRGMDFAGPVAVMARNSETVLDALRVAARFMYVHTPALSVTIDCTDIVRVVYELNEQVDRYPLQAMEASLGSTARFCAMLTESPIRQMISLTHAQHGSEDAYHAAYGCTVRFDQSWCGLEMPLEAGAARLRNADPETVRIVSKFLEDNYLPHTAALSDRVAERARGLLPTGLCSVDTIAEQLGMHPRTLQRRLAADGVQCHDVIDRERRTQAERYLGMTGLNLRHIAGLLGYSEQSALNRSCRRWFGMTPREFRAKH